MIAAERTWRYDASRACYFTFDGHTIRVHDAGGRAAWLLADASGRRLGLYRTLDQAKRGAW